jgi:hypothetical protein
VAPVRLAELLTEAAVGKGDTAVGREQADHGGQGLEHVVEALALALDGLCELDL